MRALFVVVASLLAGSDESAAQAADAPRADRPNVVLVMADDLGWGDLGHRGHPRLETPHLDAMAAAGLRFDRFYAAAPVCSPTRGSVLTGRHPHRYGIRGANNGHLLERELDLTRELKAHGYRTGHFGKWHLGTLTRTERDSNRGGVAKHAAHYAPPWDRSFDVCFSTEAKVPTWDPMRTPGDPDRAYGTAYWSGPGTKVDPEQLRGDDSALIAERAAAFIAANAAAAKPFFAVVWFHSPHEPVLAGPADLARYADVENEKERRYFGCVTALDRAIGRLRRALRDAGVADDTLLWFCSDNGPEHRNGPGSTGGLRGRKRSLYEGGIRVPGLVEWPAGIAAGSVTSTPASTSDILPTVLAALGTALPELRPLDGRSLLPVFAAPSTSLPRRIGFASRRQQAVVDGRFKLYRNTTRDGTTSTELYDLDADPAERTDLAATEPDRTRQLVAWLDRWVADCAASADGRDAARPLPGDSDYYARRGDDALARSYAVFAAGGTARVAFLGGSITHNPGWRDLVALRLRRRFPATTFEFVNAGIPSFGSVPNAFRFARDVLASGPVDLLFVEAAVNDSTNGYRPNHQLRALEGVVQQARDSNPNVDIVQLHFADPDKLRAYRAGRIPDVIATHERIAEHWALPSIDLAREVQERIDAGQFSWREDFRNLHPSPFGQTLYARSIERLFAACWDQEAPTPPTTPHRVRAPLDDRSYGDATWLTADDKRIEPGDFARTPAWRPADGKATRSGFVDVPVLEAAEPGAALRLRFDGRAIGILTNSGPDAGRVEWSVDGRSARTAELFTRWSGGLHLPWATVLTDELDAGSHVLELRVASTRAERSRGHAVRIVSFLIAR